MPELDRQWQAWGVDALLRKYRGLGIEPHTGNGLVIAGDLTFTGYHKAGGEVTDTYAIQIDVPDFFPRDTPHVWERGGRIPRDFHKLTDGDLCLGSPIRLHTKLRRRPDLVGFVETCIVPYLYGYSCFERTGVMPFGELDHLGRGLVTDYMAMLRVSDPKLCIRLLRLAAMQRRKANREQCPCGSGLRVGRCHNRRINRLRQEAGRRILGLEFHRLEPALRK